MPDDTPPISGPVEPSAFDMGASGDPSLVSQLADDQLAAVLSPAPLDIVEGYGHVLDQLTVSTDLFDVSPLHFDSPSDP